MDDVEVRRGERPVRWGEGGHCLRSTANVHWRARANDATLRVGAARLHRAGEGRTGARYEHQRTNDGLDHGYLFDARQAYGHRGGYWKANRPRRFIGPARGNWSRNIIRRRTSGEEIRYGPGKHSCGCPGLRQRWWYWRAAHA